MKFMIAIPAYNRDYKSKKAVMDDWNAGKDFQMQPSGQYLNNRDIESCKEPITLNIRYSKLASVCVIKLNVDKQ